MRRALFFIIAVQSIFCSSDTQWKLGDSLKVNHISSIDISPDGKEVLYAVTVAKFEDGANHYVTQIMRGEVGDLNTHYQFTQDNHHSASARFSPDGKTIAFISARSGNLQLYLIPANGGEGVQVTDFPYGVSAFKWSPDSKHLAVIATKYEYPEKDTESKLSDDVVEYPRNTKRSILYLVEATPSISEASPLTSSEYYIQGGCLYGSSQESFDFSPDGKNIAFTYAPDSLMDSRFKKPQIAIVNIESKKITKIRREGAVQSIPKYSPDGQTIAFQMSDKDGVYHINRTLTLYDVKTGSISTLPQTRDGGAFLFGNSLMGWSEDGNHLLYAEPFKTKFALWKVPVNGDSPKRIDNNQWFIDSSYLSPNRKWIALALENPTTPKEAFVTSSSFYNPKKVSQVNDEIKKKSVAKTKVIQWKSYDGTVIEGLLTYPKNYSIFEKYPLIVEIHGGPMGTSFESYLGGHRLYPLAALSESGFFILRPNFRGSAGYGLEHRAANQKDWGGKDFEDIMSGVDHLINNNFVDENRMGVMGWSYGGYMTAWIVSQTDRFSAGSMGAGLSNLISMSHTTDLKNFMSDYFECEFWDDSSLYLERSPIMHVHNVTTPLMIQHGLRDARVPVSQGIEFYEALKKQDKVVNMALYPRTYHGISEPLLRLDSLHRNFDWFIKHVKNKGQ